MGSGLSPWAWRSSVRYSTSMAVAHLHHNGAGVPGSHCKSPAGPTVLQGVRAGALQQVEGRPWAWGRRAALLRHHCALVARGSGGSAGSDAHPCRQLKTRMWEFGLRHQRVPWAGGKWGLLPHQDAVEGTWSGDRGPAGRAGRAARRRAPYSSGCCLERLGRPFQA